MRRQWAVLVLAGAAAVGCAAPPAATAAPGTRAVARAGTWGRAIEVPGLRSLNRGGRAQLASVSCGSAGDCVAGGSYRDGSGHAQAFLVARQNGIWRDAFKVPGSGTLNAGGAAQVTSVSCARAGNCSAAGYYLDGSGVFQVFVTSEANGTWGTAIQMPGLGILNKVDAVAPDTVSCASPGNCAAFGGYMTGAATYEAFVASETNGTWGKAMQVPGLGALNAGGNVGALSVSCGSAGSCAAAGDYKDGAGRTQAFVVSQANGTWGRAIQVPGSATLNAGGDAAAGSVSCATAGSCAAAGSHTGRRDQAQTFVTSQTSGTWGRAIQVPGSGILHAGRFGSHAAVSCATAGNCAASLNYTDDKGRQQPFVASETNGTWRDAFEIPGLGNLNAGRNASIASVSCGSAGNCAAGGTYTDGAGRTQAFVVNLA